MRAQGRGDELEGGVGVIVQAADQPRVRSVLHAQAFQAFLDLGEEGAAGLVQMLLERRCVRQHGAVARVLAVQDAQGVALQTVQTVGGEALFMAFQVGDEGAAIGLPALLVAQRVELERDVLGHAQLVQDVLAQRHDLDIAHGLGGTQELDADLVELAQAALLRPLVAEHRAIVEELERQLLHHAAGDHGACHGRRVLGPQAELVAAAVLEDVHLLGDDVGGVAQRAGEDFQMLEDGGRDLAIAVAAGKLAAGLGDHPMAAEILAQEVVGAPRWAQLRQRPAPWARNGARHRFRPWPGTRQRCVRRAAWPPSCRRRRWGPPGSRRCRAG